MTCESLRLVQRPDADLLEVHHIARVVILEADIARFGPFRLALRLVPLSLLRNVLAGRIESGDPLTVHVDQHEVALQGDDHRLPLRRFLLGRRGPGERVDGTGAMDCIPFVADLHFVAVVDREPRPPPFLGGLHERRQRLPGQLPVLVPARGSVLFLHFLQNAVVDPDVDTGVGLRILGLEDDSNLAVAELLLGINEQAEAALVGLGAQRAVIHRAAAVASLGPIRADLSLLDQGQGPPSAWSFIRTTVWAERSGQYDRQTGEEYCGSHDVPLLPPSVFALPIVCNDHREVPKDNERTGSVPID